jgi:hypothetical protein
MIDVSKHGTLWATQDIVYYGDEIIGDFAEITLLNYPGRPFELSASDVLVLVNCLLNGNDDTYLGGELELEERLENWTDDIEERINDKNWRSG